MIVKRYKNGKSWVEDKNYTDNVQKDVESSSQTRSKTNNTSSNKVSPPEKSNSVWKKPKIKRHNKKKKCGCGGRK